MISIVILVYQRVNDRRIERPIELLLRRSGFLGSPIYGVWCNHHLSQCCWCSRKAQLLQTHKNCGCVITHRTSSYCTCYMNILLETWVVTFVFRCATSTLNACKTEEKHPDPGHLQGTSARLLADSCCIRGCHVHSNAPCKTRRPHPQEEPPLGQASAQSWAVSVLVDTPW